MSSVFARHRKRSSSRLAICLCVGVVGIVILGACAWADVEDVLELVKGNLVMIECTCERAETKVVRGQGIIIGQTEGEVYIATAKHVVTSTTPGCPESTSVTFHTPSETSPMLRKRLNGDHDLAILVVEAPHGLLWEKKILDVTPPVRDENVWLYRRTHPWQIPAASSRGYVSVFERDRALVLFQKEAVVPGDSGGPLITREGVVGLVRETGEEYDTALHIDQVPILMSGWGEEWQPAWQLKPFERDTAFWIGRAFVWNIPHSEGYLGYCAGFSCPAEEIIEGIGAWDLSVGGSMTRTDPHMVLSSVTVSAFQDIRGALGDRLADHRFALNWGVGLGFVAWEATNPELSSPFASICICGRAELGLRFSVPSGIGVRAFVSYSVAAPVPTLAGYPCVGMSIRMAF